MKRIVLICIAIVLWCGAAALGAAQEARVCKTLDNGCTIVVVESHSSRVAAVFVFVRAGSVYEREYIGAGVSHLTEHLVHGGATERRAEEDSHRELNELGNNTNAFTSKNVTSYFIETTPQHVAQAVDLLADWTLHATISQEAFDREHQVVMREQERNEDNPDRVLWQSATESMFRVHPVRYPIIGVRPVLADVTRDDLYNYYKRMYVPNNMVVVAVGDFDRNQVADLIEKAFGAAEAKPIEPNALPTEPEQVAPREKVKEFDTDITRSRLVKEVRIERQLVSYITSYSYTPAFDAGEFTILAQTTGEKLAETKAAIFELLGRIREEGPTSEELERAKTVMAADYYFDRQSAASIARQIGLDLLSAGDPDFSRTYVEHVEEVRADDVKRVAREYLTPETLCVTVLKPKEAPSEAVSAGAVGAAAGEKGAAVTRRLDNGITVIVGTNRAQPIVSVQAYLRAGLPFETPQNNGLFSFMGEMLTKGTTNRSREDISSFFDSTGGSINSGAGNFTFYIGAAALKEKFKESLDIFADCLKNPTFPEAEIEKLRRLVLVAIQRERDEPVSDAIRLFRERFFGENPLGMSNLGTEESVRALGRSDLVEAHKRYCVGGNLVVAVYGDVGTDEAVELVADAFADFPRGTIEQPAEQPPVVLEADRLETVATGKQNAVVMIGYPGVSLRDFENRFAMMVADVIASGYRYPGGWLHSALRGEGLVYEVHAYNWMPPGEPGYFGVYARTQPATASEVAERCAAIIERLGRGDFTDEELATAKNRIVTTEALGLQTNAQRAQDAAINELYGLGYDFSSRLSGLVEKVSREDVMRVANTYLKKRFTLIVTPDADGERQEP